MATVAEKNVRVEYHGATVQCAEKQKRPQSSRLGWKQGGGHSGNAGPGGHRAAIRPSTAREGRRQPRPASGRRHALPGRPRTAAASNTRKGRNNVKNEMTNMFQLYHLLCPLNPQFEGVGIKVRIAETIFLSENYTFVSWFTNDRKGLVRKRPAGMLTRDHIKKKMHACRERKMGKYNPLCVLRRMSDVDLVDSDGLKDFFDDMDEYATESVPSSGKAAAAPEQCAAKTKNCSNKQRSRTQDDVVAIQEYIPAHNDTRYVVAFINDPSTARAACEVFALTYSNVATDLSRESLNMERIIGRVPPPKPKVDVLKDEATGTALKRLTMEIVHYLNSRSIRATLDGLVCEYIVDSSEMSKQSKIKQVRPNETAVLTAILGSKWRGAVPSWVHEKGSNDTADLLCTLVPRIDYKELALLDLTKTSAVGKASYPGNHLRQKVTRVLGPGMLSQMASELEQYQTTLGYEIQRAQTAQSKLEQVNHDLQAATKSRDDLAQQLTARSEEYHLTVTDCRRLSKLLSKTEKRNKSLEETHKADVTQVSELNHIIQTDRATSFKVMGQLQHKIDVLSDTKEQHEETIGELHAVNADQLQVNLEQGEMLAALRKQLVEYSEKLKETTSVLQQTRDVLETTRKERDHYRRSIPHTGSDGHHHRKPPFHLHLGDLFEGHGDHGKMEMWMLTNYLHEIKALFKELFNKYVSHSHDDSEPMLHDNGFHHFLKDVLVISDTFHIADADIIMQKAHARGGKRAVYNHKYNCDDFAETLVRIAHVLYHNQEDYLTECVRQFVKEYLLPFATSQADTAAKNEVNPPTHV